MISAKNLRRPIKTAQYDPNISLADNWDISDPLNFGWFGYASIDLVEQYRNAGSAGPQRSAYLQAMMQIEVQQKIGARAAMAIGIRLPPVTDLAPEILPPNLFKSSSVVIDWDEGVVTALGHSFGDVRLCVPLQTDDPTRPASDPVPPAKRGRPSFAEKLEGAFVSLIASDEHFTSQTQEKQIHAIREKAAALHPRLFLKTGPSRSTVARFLMARREANS